jgi:hypothetical protein
MSPAGFETFQSCREKLRSQTGGAPKALHFQPTTLRARLTGSDFATVPLGNRQGRRLSIECGQIAASVTLHFFCQKSRGADSQSLSSDIYRRLADQERPVIEATHAHFNYSSRNRPRRHRIAVPKSRIDRVVDSGTETAPTPLPACSPKCAFQTAKSRAFVE